MDLAGWRDIALYVIAILYILVTIVVAGVAFAIWWFGRKGFNAVDRLVAEKVRPALDQVEMQLLTVRDRTARLPGNQALGLGEAPAKKKGGLPLPFGRKKKRRIPLLPS
jgi:hypothetical protein